MRLGIFGGSFDPVHYGHLELARACQQQAALDEVWFTPTAVQPLKQHGPTASDADRVEMLQLAIADEPTWRVCKLEIDRGGLSYTVDTIRQTHEELPEAVLYFLMGADTVRDVPQWRKPAEIFRLATPLVVRRAGAVDPDMSTLKVFSNTEREPRLIEMPQIDVSSRDIRRRAALGESIDGLIPDAVCQYIRRSRLYQ